MTIKRSCSKINYHQRHLRIGGKWRGLRLVRGVAVARLRSRLNSRSSVDQREKSGYKQGGTGMWKPRKQCQEAGGNGDWLLPSYESSFIVVTHTIHWRSRCNLFFPPFLNQKSHEYMSYGHKLINWGNRLSVILIRASFPAYLPKYCLSNFLPNHYMDLCGLLCVLWYEKKISVENHIVKEPERFETEPTKVEETINGGVLMNNRPTMVEETTNSSASKEKSESQSTMVEKTLKSGVNMNKDKDSSSGTMMLSMITHHLRQYIKIICEDFVQLDHETNCRDCYYITDLSESCSQRCWYHCLLAFRGSGDPCWNLYRVKNSEPECTWKQGLFEDWLVPIIQRNTKHLPNEEHHIFEYADGYDLRFLELCNNNAPHKHSKKAKNRETFPFFYYYYDSVSFMTDWNGNGLKTIAFDCSKSNGKTNQLRKQSYRKTNQLIFCYIKPVESYYFYTKLVCLWLLSWICNSWGIKGRKMTTFCAMGHVRTPGMMSNPPSLSCCVLILKIKHLGGCFMFSCKDYENLMYFDVICELLLDYVKLDLVYWKETQWLNYYVLNYNANIVGRISTLKDLCYAEIRGKSRKWSIIEVKNRTGGFDEHKNNKECTPLKVMWRNRNNMNLNLAYCYNQEINENSKHIKKRNHHNKSLLNLNYWDEFHRLHYYNMSRSLCISYLRQIQHLILIVCGVQGHFGDLWSRLYLKKWNIYSIDNDFIDQAHFDWCICHRPHICYLPVFVTGKQSDHKEPITEQLDWRQPMTTFFYRNEFRWEYSKLQD